ncbi:MAG: hypothetical protein OHK0046_37040 [Anaerolineae bacterium]
MCHTVPSLFRVTSQLNRWSLRRREGSVQRNFVPAPVRRWPVAAARYSVEDHAERTHPYTILRCALVLSGGQPTVV